MSFKSVVMLVTRSLVGGQECDRGNRGSQQFSEWSLHWSLCHSEVIQRHTSCLLMLLTNSPTMFQKRLIICQKTRHTIHIAHCTVYTVFSVLCTAQMYTSVYSVQCTYDTF